MSTPDMAYPELVIPESAWEAVGVDGDRHDTEDMLLTQVMVNGRQCHAQAVRVVVDADQLRAASPMYEAEFAAIVELLQDPPQTQEIRGRQYAVYVLPHGQ